MVCVCIAIVRVFGVLVFSIPNLEQPLFPMLSGLFGISSLIVSLSEKTVLPQQSFAETIKLEPRIIAKAVGAGTFSGALTGIFLGLAAQAATLASELVGKMGIGMMVLVGGIGTVSSLFFLSDTLFNR